MGQFDAVIVDPCPGLDSDAVDSSGGPFDLFPELGQGIQTAFEKFLFTGDDRNIHQIYVAGNRVI